MTVPQLAEHLPIIQSAIRVQAILPPPMQSTLSSAIFAYAAILALSDDPAESAIALLTQDLSNAGNLEVDDLYLEMVTDSAAMLATSLGSYLPITEVIDQLQASGVLREGAQGFLAMGQKNLVIHFYGNEFLLLDGQLLIDTPRGRIHQVLYVDYAKQQAVFEVCSSPLDGVPNFKIFGYDQGQLRERVGAITADSFRCITYNDFGSRVGVFNYLGKDYLFQDGHQFSLELEGKFIKADFLKSVRSPAGIIETSKYIYLIREGTLFEQIAISDFDTPQNIKLHCDLVDPNASDFVVFWGVLEYPDRTAAYLNSEISRYNYNNLEFPCLVFGEMRRFESTFYFVMEFGGASEQQALAQAKLNLDGIVELEIRDSLDGQQFTKIEYLPDFPRTGESILHFGSERLYFINNQCLGDLGDGREIIGDLPITVLPGSAPVFSHLISTYQGWVILGSSNKIFYLPLITFSTEPGSVQVYLDPDKGPTIFGIGKNGERHLFIHGKSLHFTNSEIFQELVGFYSDDEVTTCVLKTTSGYLCLELTLEGDSAAVQSFAITDYEVHPWGIIGNTKQNGREGMIIGHSFFPNRVFRKATTIIDPNGQTSPLIETDQGCLLLNSGTGTTENYPDLILHPTELEGERVVKKRSTFSHHRVDIGVNFNVLAGSELA